MRYVKDVLRLRFQNHLSVRQIASSCGLPASTVGDYLNRAQAAGLSWPLPTDMTDPQIMERLLNASAPAPTQQQAPVKPLPDWPALHEQLNRDGVTLQLLWQEYFKIHPQGYKYSRFCELYERWAHTLDPVLRLTHQPGHKLFVDWAGQKTPLYHQDGSQSQASLFVAVLGASNKTFVHAFENEKIESWISAHCMAFDFYAGVPKTVVPDNPKTAVIHACRYEPVLHRSYLEMAEHYGTVILPARAAHPRDKAKVETAVQIAQRQILAALRDQRFFSVAQLNQAIKPLLDKLNDQPFQKLDGSRNSWFDSREKDKLLPLPKAPYELATWSKSKVNIDYHAVVDNHFYSVPYKLIHQELDVRMGRLTVELFYQGKRVAAHARSHEKGKFTTIQEHRPKAHQAYLDWTPSRMVDWAQKTGPWCAKAVDQILQSKTHPEQGYRSAMGIIRLGKSFGSGRLEAACSRALSLGTCSYKSIKSILENGLDRLPPEPELPLNSPSHENVRGQVYYA